MTLDPEAQAGMRLANARLLMTQSRFLIDTSKLVKRQARECCLASRLAMEPAKRLIGSLRMAQD